MGDEGAESWEGIPFYLELLRDLLGLLLLELDLGGRDLAPGPHADAVCGFAWDVWREALVEDSGFSVGIVPMRSHPKARWIDSSRMMYSNCSPMPTMLF